MYYFWLGKDAEPQVTVEESWAKVNWQNETDFSMTLTAHSTKSSVIGHP